MLALGLITPFGTASPPGSVVLRWDNRHFPYFGRGVSGDGKVVVGMQSAFGFGSEDGEGFLWRIGEGATERLRQPPANIWHGVKANSDGSVIVGFLNESGAASATRAVIWHGASTVAFVFNRYSDAFDVSADGRVVVGRKFDSFNNFDSMRGWRWTEATGLEIFGVLPGSPRSYATAVSADGETVLGSCYGAGLPYRPFRWTRTEGMVEILPPAGASSAGAVGCSHDGSIVVIWADVGGVRHSFVLADGAFEDLGSIDGFPNIEATAISDDGTTVVGNAKLGNASRAFVWTRERGIRTLADALADYDPHQTDRTYYTAMDVSADGSVVVGWAYASGLPSGTSAYMAILRNVDGCQADYNLDGHVSLQDLFDYLEAHFNGCFDWQLPNCRYPYQAAWIPPVERLRTFLAHWFVGC